MTKSMALVVLLLIALPWFAIPTRWYLRGMQPNVTVLRIAGGVGLVFAAIYLAGCFYFLCR